MKMATQSTQSMRSTGQRSTSGVTAIQATKSLHPLKIGSRRFTVRPRGKTQNRRGAWEMAPNRLHEQHAQVAIAALRYPAQDRAGMGGGHMTAIAMPADKFWHIIERAAQSDRDPDAHAEALRMALRELSLEEIVSFEVAFRRYLNNAYTWDLWGAAY